MVLLQKPSKRRDKDFIDSTWTMAAGKHLHTAENKCKNENTIQFCSYRIAKYNTQVPNRISCQIYRWLAVSQPSRTGAIIKIV